MTLRPPLLKTMGSEARLRILLALAKYGRPDLTVYKIAKFSGLDRKAVRRNLRLLLEADFVKAKSYGSLALYRLNYENVYVQKLVDLFNGTMLLAHAPSHRPPTF